MATRFPLHRLLLPILFLALGVFVAPVKAGTEAPLLSLARIRELASEKPAKELTFRLKGMVCAVSHESRLMALQDETGTAILEIPSIPKGISPGFMVVIGSEHCSVSRGRFAIQLGTSAVVEIDGHHSPLTRSGSVYLSAGLQPLRIEWFNGYTDATLKLAYDGPGLSRQDVPPSAYFHRQNDSGDLKPGLEYRSYTGSFWAELPNFSALTPSVQGVSPSLDVALRPRPEDSGLVFSGYLQVAAEGKYSFHLTSDDGARVFVGEPAMTCSVVGSDDKESAVPEESTWAGDISGTTNLWVNAEGTVTFAYAKDGRLELDVTGENTSFHVTVPDGHGLSPSTFLQKRVRLKGVALREGIIVVDKKQLSIIEVSPEDQDVITQIVQVRRLRPEDAGKPCLARIRGIITMTTPTSVVIQDSTGGVFVHYPTQISSELPKPGEMWEIEGDTHPGDFSPVIMAKRAAYTGRASLPEAVRPTSEQLVSGSLDAERIELEGVVISADTAGIHLLTREGNIRIEDNRFYPLPIRTMTAPELQELPGSVIRIRGVLAPRFNSATRRVDPEVIRLGNSAITVDELEPKDPFSTPLIPASDLFLFTSHPTAFKRVKVSGVVVHARPPEYFLSDGQKGFRIISRDKTELVPGDDVDAVGFPRLGGPSPLLLEVHVRKKGKVPIPGAIPLAAAGLPASRMDSIRVMIDASVVSDTVQRDERVIELQAGSSRFVARLSAVAGGLKPIQRGSLVRVSGVYANAPGTDVVTTSSPFDLLLNSPSDIQILKRGPWWTPRHTIAVIATLSGGLLLALAWVTVLRRIVGQRGRQLALEIEGRQMVERHRAMEQERIRVAQDLHDELGSGLTEAGILSSLLKNPQIPEGKKKEYLDQLSVVCRTLVTGLDEIVWAVNPCYDSVPDLASYYSLFAQGFLSLAGITCRQNIDDSIPLLPLDSTVRHGVFLAFKEALNNIVKHADAKEVRLAIKVDGSGLSVSLSDDGCGFNTASALPGSDGLNGMKQRMEKLGGSCDVLSVRGEGTTVTLTLPLGRSEP